MASNSLLSCNLDRFPHGHHVERPQFGDQQPGPQEENTNHRLHLRSIDWLLTDIQALLL